ncbi:hypothetical protein RJ639_043169 [Escallonia herrerae]|uniref:COBRA C-terminal domain-containing protein n=1 Tax=Escallonia herrerae TaxID=1293975 RepID=A0AA88WCA0_9ASTE|nr:hypothetical protein RJ639_043169 [Escallonia herrerae]
MKTTSTGMKIPWGKVVVPCIAVCVAQDFGDGGGATGAAPPPEADTCDGIFLAYNFEGREKEYPRLKNASAQPYSFKASATVLNAGSYELKSWQIFIGFQHDEILVSADGAMVMDGDGLPLRVGNNGTHLVGYPQTDLKTAIETAGDQSQIMAKVEMKGTQFGVKKGDPMPKTIKLVNDGYKCPAPKRYQKSLHVCCTRDPKFKPKQTKTKFMPRQNGDLSFTYDVLQAYEGNYLAQVTIDNNNPLGRLDHWNLTWEWMRNEFIYSMRGAYTHKKDPSECIYGAAGQYYKDFDFSQVMNCQKKPVIADLPAEKANDDKVGKLPYCCRNGSILPTTMNETKARSIFQLQVYKLPPDLNRTALNPPQNWKIDGLLNPNYKCGPPIRVDPTEFPDPSGLQATSSAIASWQVTCNITKPKPKQSRCCVSFSAYYAESVIPCNTCACGCEEETKQCNPNAKPMLLPPEALLVPFANRTAKAKAWADLKHLPNPKPLPCPDNCGVSINWHVDSDYKTGWTARITLFNWDEFAFEDWFTAIQIKKAYPGYQNVYSFNGTKLPGLNNTIFMQGLPGLNFLVGETNGTDPKRDPRVPGKQQSVISFLKKDTPNINVAAGDGFPTKVIFNGEECALPTQLPKRSGAHRSSRVGFLPAILLAVLTFVLMNERFQ